MNELRVDLTGDNRGFQRATDEAVGIARSAAAKMDEANKKSASDYSSWWGQVLEKQEAAEAILTKKRLEDIAEVKAAQQAANMEMMAGSGGQSWRTSAVQRAEAGGMGGGGAMIATQATTDLLSKGFKEAAHGAMEAGKSLLLFKVYTDLLNGKMPLKELSKVPHHLAQVGEGFAKLAPLLARVTGITAIIVGAEEIARASIRAGSAAKASDQSQKDLHAQTGNLGERLTDYIAEQVRSGDLSEQEAARLKGMLNSHEGIVKAQRELIAMGDKKAAAADEKGNKDAGYDARKQAADDELAKLQQKDTTEAQYATDLSKRLEADKKIKEDMAKLDQNSTEYKQRAAVLAEDELQIEKDKQALKRMHAKPEEKHHMESMHIDEMSSTGLFQSAGAVSNPMLDTARQQLTQLQAIAHNTARQHQDPYAP